jgi:hypothetical protein
MLSNAAEAHLINKSLVIGLKLSSRVQQQFNQNI